MDRPISISGTDCKAVFDGSEEPQYGWERDLARFESDSSLEGSERRRLPAGIVDFIFESRPKVFDRPL